MYFIDIVSLIFESSVYYYAIISTRVRFKNVVESARPMSLQTLPDLACIHH